MVAAREDICRLMTAESGAAGCGGSYCSLLSMPAGTCWTAAGRSAICAALMPRLLFRLSMQHSCLPPCCAGKPLAEARAEFDNG